MVAGLVLEQLRRNSNRTCRRSASFHSPGPAPLTVGSLPCVRPQLRARWTRPGAAGLGWHRRRWPALLQQVRSCSSLRSGRRSSPCQHSLGFVDLGSLECVALRAWACSPCVKPCLLIAARALAIGLQLHRDQSGRPSKNQIGETPTGSVHESALQVAGVVDPPAHGFRQLDQMTLQSAFALIRSRAPTRATQGQASNHQPLIAGIAAPDALGFRPTARMQCRHTHRLPLGGRRVLRGSTGLAAGTFCLQLQHRTRAPRSRGVWMPTSTMAFDCQDVTANTSPRRLGAWSWRPLGRGSLG